MSETEQQRAALQGEFEKYVNEGLKLDLTRGKPSAEQLDLSNELDGILDGFYMLQDGSDVRNYGGILGIPEARNLGGEIFGVDPACVMAGGNSSLNLMYQFVNFMLPLWQATTDKIRFICPVPGYDRHFTVCEHFDIEMIPVPMTGNGPDMDRVEELVAEDESIRGIWCVPRYSNPTGETYDDDTVKRMARLGGIAGADFQVFWDNAYIVHDLREEPPSLTNLFTVADELGTTANVVMFASTSKITFAGAGVAFMATDETRLKAFEKYLSDQMIGFDKVNQLRHVHFLKNLSGVREHMAKHRELIRPKFDLVLEKLDARLGGKDIADWCDPPGGYFISLDTKPGLASEVVAMTGEAGVKLTPAGATFPYGKDPEDRNIRLAPTYPSLEELDKAMDVFVTCLELATLNADAEK